MGQEYSQTRCQHRSTVLKCFNAQVVSGIYTPVCIQVEKAERLVRLLKIMYFWKLIETQKGQHNEVIEKRCVGVMAAK